MIVTPVPHGLDLLATDLVRSPGLHASTIYGDLYKALDPKRYDLPGPPDHLLWAIGTAWEKHLEYLFTKNGIEFERPDEFMSPEGIAFSPDLLIVWNGVLRLGEIKYTSMSAKDMPVEVSNNLPPKLDKYDTQMKLYAYWLDMRDGMLAVLFNWDAMKPDLRFFELTWTDRELQENFLMCMNFAKERGML